MASTPGGFFRNSPSGRRTSDLFANTVQRGGRSGVRNPSTNLERLGPTVANPQAVTPDDAGTSPQGVSGLTRAWTGARNGDGSPNLTSASSDVQGVASRARAVQASSKAYAPTPYAPQQPAPGAPGTTQPPAPTATTNAAQQTESANPLTGTSNNLPMGKTETLPSTAPTTDINHARAMGYSSAGSGTPKGQDITTPGATPDAEANGTDPSAMPALGSNPGAPQTYSGGVGAYQRQFSNWNSASVYHDYVKKLFGSAPPTQPGSAPSMLAKTGPAFQPPGGDDT